MIGSVIAQAKKYVTIHLKTDNLELENIDYIFQSGEYLVGEVDLSAAKNIKSMNHAFDGDTNVTKVILDTSSVIDAQYAFRGTKLEKLDMNNFNFSSPEHYEGLISGVTTLKEITLKKENVTLWSDIVGNLKNDIKLFIANDCNFIQSMDCSAWTACEVFEVSSDQLTDLKLFSNKNSLSTFRLKAPKVNIGTDFVISSNNLEYFELKTKGVNNLSLSSSILKSIDISDCTDVSELTITAPFLKELDVSNTLITDLNITGFTNLKAPKTSSVFKGWYARNCTALKTVTMRIDQVRSGISDMPLQLDGCTALESVTVYSEGEGESGGIEYHYGTEHHYGKMYLNDKEVSIVNVENNLTSTSTASALSANMGKSLNDKKLEVDGSNATEAGTSKQISTLGNGDSIITDSTDLITSHVNGYSTTNKSFYKRKASYLWEYIKSKLSSVLKINAWTTFSTYRYVATESPTTTYYWYKIGTWNPYIKDTLYYNNNTGAYDDVLEFEIIGDSNYPYFGHYILRISKYINTSVSLRLENLGTSGNAELAVAIDAQGNVYIQGYAIWQLRSRVRVISGNGLYKTMSMTNVGYAAFGTANGFTALKVYKNNCASKFTISTSGVVAFFAEYTNKIFGNVERAITADTATKATQDANGNTITSTYMKTSNPTGTGSFSMNRKAGTTVGTNSHAEGGNTTASGVYSHAEGYETIAGGEDMHAAGKYNKTTTGVARVTGWGTSSAKKDIEILDTNGNLKIAGDVYVGLDANGNANKLKSFNAINITQADYNKLSAADKQKDVLYNITDVSENSPTAVHTYAETLTDAQKAQVRKNLDLETYSTTEKKVGTWIDGKPLYRKVFIINQAMSSSFEKVHNIPNVDMIHINYGVSFGKEVSSEVNFPLTFAWYFQTWDAMTWFVNKTKLQMTCQTGWGTNWTWTVVLEYTKTTD